ncbi:MAG: class I SAM-dependent methyltransferase [Planctomycetes bacterium]|nr:class I SAM-dependent methyltransferase [Planctomycetota bacterium]
MNVAEFDRMFAVEETHWWYRGRRALVRAALDRYLPAPRPLEMLDLASATGASIRFLSDYGSVRGIDISEETIRLCGLRGIDRIVQGDALHLPFADGSFDAVLALDAFEHFEDDVAAMAEVHRVLRPGGLLVATVPAFMALWSPHDVAYHHYRRYRRPQLRERLESVGFRTERMSYSSMLLSPAVWMLRSVRRRRNEPATEATSDFAVPFPRPVEVLAAALTRFEIAVERVVDLPFGVSLYGVLRKAE